MSIDYIVYVGPFLKCKVGKKEKEEEQWGCEKCKTKFWQKDKSSFQFCSACRSKHTSYTLKNEVEAVNVWDLNEKINSNLHYVDLEDDYHFWFGNQDKDIGYSIDPVEAGNGHKLLNMFSPEQDRTKFRTFYAKELEKIYEAYGEANVFLLWGVCHWSY